MSKVYKYRANTELLSIGKKRDVSGQAEIPVHLLKLKILNVKV